LSSTAATFVDVVPMFVQGKPNVSDKIDDASVVADGDSERIDVNGRHVGDSTLVS
jgi:hypothetical protein